MNQPQWIFWWCSALLNLPYIVRRETCRQNNLMMNLSRPLQKILIPLRPKSNRLIRIKYHKGHSSVKSAYRMSQAHAGYSNTSNLPWQRLWRNKVHQRVKMLLSRIENLQQSLEIVDTGCVRKLLNCPVANAIWFGCWSLRSQNLQIECSQQYRHSEVDLFFFLRISEVDLKSSNPVHVF